MMDGHGADGFSLSGLTGGRMQLHEHRGASGRLISFLGVTLVPTLLAAVYLLGFASDQYISEFRFSVRQSSAMPVETSSLSQSFSGGTSLLAAAIDSQIVVSYIESQQILSDLRGRVDIGAVFGSRKADAYARLRPGSPAELELRYWRRMVDPYFDLSSGLVSVKVRSFSPGDSQRIAQSVLGLSEALVNRLSERARRDRLSYSDAQVGEAELRLRRSESALAAYRNQHGIVYPLVHAGENSTLDAVLRQEINQLSAQLGTLRARGVSAGSPQLEVLQARLGSLRGQLAQVQSELTRPVASPGDASGLATTLGGYEELDVENQIAQHAYEHALGLRQQAQSEAAQQQVYLSAFVEPNLPEASLYPRRFRSLFEVFLGSCALWALGALVFFGIREHLD